MAKTENGYFLIADITGYTHFLSASELEHAHEILQTLMELLIQHTRPPLIISRLAGDAVISYGLRDNFLTGQTFLEMIEDTYVAFRRAIDLMVLNTNCECNACANINTLDLKFFVHYGEFTRQHLDFHDELLGPDVIVIHRLLKNHVTEKTGLRAYALYTDAAIRQLAIEDVCAAMTKHDEEYEHLGIIKTWIQDMHPVWQTKKETLKIEIHPDQANVQASADFLVPVEIMWDLLSDPDYRSPLLGAVNQKALNRQNGRLAPGSQFQCFHGNNRETTETILEWIPFEQMTTEDTTPVPNTTCLVNLRLTPIASGTRLTITASKAKGPFLLRLICDLVGQTVLPKTFGEGLKKLQDHVNKDLAEGKFKLPQITSIPTDHIHQAITTSLSET